MLACFTLDALKFCDGSSENILKTPTLTFGVEAVSVTRHLFDKRDTCPPPHLATPLLKVVLDPEEDFSQVFE